MDKSCPKAKEQIINSVSGCRSVIFSMLPKIAKKVSSAADKSRLGTSANHVLFVHAFASSNVSARIDP